MNKIIEPAKTSRLYQIYHGMKQRCHQKNDKDYYRYGGKGILVCEEWKYSYVTFREWALSNGYKDPLTIDRKDTTKGYNPDNCQWITRWENDRKNAVPITAFGETKFIWEWETDNRCVVTKPLLRQRLWRKWPSEKALTTPKK